VESSSASWLGHSKICALTRGAQLGRAKPTLISAGLGGSAIAPSGRRCELESVSLHLPDVANSKPLTELENKFQEVLAACHNAKQELLRLQLQPYGWPRQAARNGRRTGNDRAA
jgi:hypothetical protein